MVNIVVKLGRVKIMKSSFITQLNLNTENIFNFFDLIDFI